MNTMRVRAKLIASPGEAMSSRVLKSHRRVGPAALRRAGPPYFAGDLAGGGPALEASLSHPTTLFRWPAQRVGTSLTEVLMSLMIMSIGVVSVATLFPISALRTLEANKQTNSTIARFTAEALVDVDPQFVHNPDGFYAFPGASVGDSTPYNSAVSVMPPGPPPVATFRAQNYLVDPIGWQAFNESPTTPGSPLPSPFSAYPPALDAVRDFFGNTAPAVVNLPLPRRYTGASLFATPYPTTPAQLIAARARAAALVAQPDNWKPFGEGQFVDSIPSGTLTGITGVTLDNDTNLSAVSPASGGTYRAVIYDIDGDYSEVRYGITASYNGTSNAWEVTWLDPLPARFNSPGAGALPNIGKVRIEVADQVYSWMLSVRKRPSGPASVDVVVFFKRNFDPNNERVFDAEFRKFKLWQNAANDYDGTLAQRVPGATGDDNGINGAEDVGEIGYPGIYTVEQDVPNGTVTIKVPSTATDDERPKARRGGYIYDTKNGLWYRIRAVQNQQFGVGSGSNEDWVDLVLDESIRQDSTEDLDGSGNFNLTGEDRNGNAATVPAPERGGAIVHPNVVNVFPLEIKEP